MAKWLAIALLLVGNGFAQTHPTLILSRSMLAALVTKVAKNDPTWIRLKAICDSNTGAAIWYPDNQVYSQQTAGSGTNLVNYSYEGSGYFYGIVNNGLCYQALLPSNPSAAAVYAREVLYIMLAATDPKHQVAAGTQESPMIQDSGYAQRFVPAALALGFDWVYSSMSSTQKTQIIQNMNNWIDTWRLGWAYPTVSGGSVTGAVILNKGIDFASTPACSVQGGGGSGASCAFTIDGNGNINSVTIGSGGSGYTSRPVFLANDSSLLTFEGAHPMSNYYAGFYWSELLVALSTQGDNPEAANLYNDWINNTNGGVFQPWLGAYLAGGGWPEGFLNYGERPVVTAAIAEQVLNDNKGINLTTLGSYPLTFPLDTITYMLYSTWPSQWAQMDEGAGYCNSTGCGQNINAVSNFAHYGFYEALAGIGKLWAAPNYAKMHKFAKEVQAAVVTEFPSATVDNLDTEPWADFLYWNSQDADEDYSTLPLSYKASGQQHVFARSDWTSSALWLFMNFSPYVEAPSQGEQLFGTGQLELVHGATPFIVIPMGWSLHLPDGDNGKDHGTCDLIGSCASPQAGRDRKWYNTFQVFDYSGTQTDFNQYAGPAAIPLLPTGEALAIGGSSIVSISAFEDDGRNYLLATAAHLESMMRPWAGAPAAWTRQVLYLRPTNQVLVYDRTEVPSSSNFDQVLAWHTASKPSVVSQNPGVAGTTREDVTYNSTFAGSIISLLPPNASVDSGDLDGGSTVWRTEIRSHGCTASSEGGGTQGGCPTVAPATNQWLTVLDGNTSASAVFNASVIVPSQGNLTCAFLKGASNSVSCFNLGAAGTSVSGTIKYRVPDTNISHVITELPPGSAYSVSAVSGTITVTPQASGPYITTSAGVLFFTTSPTGVSGPVVQPPSEKPAPPMNLKIVVK